VYHTAYYFLRGMLMYRLKECGSMLRVFDMCRMFDRCLILVKKSERVYNIVESRAPPRPSRAHPLKLYHISDVLSMSNI